MARLQRQSGTAGFPSFPVRSQAHRVARERSGRNPVAPPDRSGPCPPARRHFRPAGFTLLEMLLALVIAAFLMAVAVPNFGPLLARTQLYSATRDVASALRHARGQALIRGRDAEFELNVDRHYYRITGRHKAYRLPSQVRLSLYTAETETPDEGSGRIRFFPDGSATGGRVTLEGGGQTRAVDVSWLTGEVKIREGAVED